MRAHDNEISASPGRDIDGLGYANSPTEKTTMTLDFPFFTVDPNTESYASRVSTGQEGTYSRDSWAGGLLLGPGKDASEPSRTGEVREPRTLPGLAAHGE